MKSTAQAWESQGHGEREKREGRVRRGNLFLFSCSWASPQAHVSKRPPRSRWARGPIHGRTLNTRDLSNLRQIWWNGECKDRFKKDKYVSLQVTQSAAIILRVVAWTTETGVDIIGATTYSPGVLEYNHPAAILNRFFFFQSWYWCRLNTVEQHSKS